MPDRADFRPRQVGLVLAGGGARGAYEIGALSVLLPQLKQEDVPDIIIGTSVGAINAVFLALHMDDPDRGMQAAGKLWEETRWDQVLEPLQSWNELAELSRSVVNWFGGHKRQWSMLYPDPLERTLEGWIGSDLNDGRIGKNIKQGHLTAAAVVATSAATNLSVVFHEGKTPEKKKIESDPRRGIEYVGARLGVDHVRASAAIPAAFPAVEVNSPAKARGWYFDGGTRLNTPIKPARKLGAKKLIVVALNAPTLDTSAAFTRNRADMYDGLGQVAQAVLVDPLVNDLHTLATINTLVRDGSASTATRDYEPIPYILVSPEKPFEIGKIAKDVYDDHYSQAGALTRDSVARLGKLLDAGRNLRHAELFSYLLFDGVFAAKLIEQGIKDAERWLAQTHDEGIWQLRPLS
jgi:NTE family protein